MKEETEQEIVVATIANQMFGQLTLQQALEILQGATIQAAQGEYERMPEEKKAEILEQGAAWRQQIQDQFKSQQEEVKAEEEK